MDSNQLLNIMNLASMASPPSPAKTKTSNANSSHPMSHIDTQINTEALRICKCLVPYLPYEKQKNFVVMLKIFELISVHQYYSEPQVLDRLMVNPRESPTWQSDLLHSIKHNLDPSHAYLVDIFFSINNIRQILNTAQSSQELIPSSLMTDNAQNKQNNKEETSAEVIERLSPMLDANQKNMLKMLSTIMK